MKAFALFGLLCTGLACDRAAGRDAPDFSVLAVRSVPAVSAKLTIPVGWSSIAPPAPESEEARCANWSRDAWKVSVDAEKVLIHADSGERDADTAVVTGGRLTSVNRGEFGGQVWWEPSSGRRTKIAETNLVSFIATKAGLFGLVGLAHLSLNEGGLVHFERQSSGTWNMKRVSNLRSAPHAHALLPSGKLLVVTSGTLIEASLEGAVRSLHDNPVWSFTYPSSVVRDGSGTIYLGMRSAVARLIPDAGGYREEWLVPSNCRNRRVRESAHGCTCVANGQ